MTEVAAAVEAAEQVVVSDFDRLVAAARTDTPRAAGALDGVRSRLGFAFARTRQVAAASVPGDDVGIVRYARLSMWHLIVVCLLALGAVHYAHRHGVRQGRDEERAEQQAKWDGQAAAAKTILAAATKRADAAEAKAVGQQAQLDDYAQKLAAKPPVETVTVIKEVPREVVRNVLVPVPHETVRTVVLAGKPVPGGGCALSDDDVRRLSAFAPDAPASPR